MPRVISAGEKARAVQLIIEGKLSQRDIEKETGLSRPFLRKISREIGHQFPRNGVEVIGKLCMCSNCSTLFRRPPSKVERAKNQFCSEECRIAFMKGPNHPAWKTGITAASYSQWIKNQVSYDKWREAVLQRDGYMCVISGKTDDLQVHHILPKAEGFNPEKALDPANGITINREVHERIHAVIHEGNGFEEAVEMVRTEYKNKSH